MFVCIIFLSNNTQIKLYSYNNALNIEDRQKLLTNIASAFQLYRANNCAPLRSQACFARPISRMCASFSHLCRACSEVCNVATCMREILTYIYIYIYIYTYKSTVGKGKQYAGGNYTYLTRVRVLLYAVALHCGTRYLAAVLAHPTA